MMLMNFGLKMHLGVTQNRTAAIFETLIFRDFSEGQNPKISQIGELNFDPQNNREKLNFQNSPLTTLYHPKMYHQKILHLWYHQSKFNQISTLRRLHSDVKILSTSF